MIRRISTIPSSIVRSTSPPSTRLNTAMVARRMVGEVRVLRRRCGMGLKVRASRPLMGNASRIRLHACILALAIGCISNTSYAQTPERAPSIGPQFETRGLRPQQSEIDDVLSRSFGCSNQHGVKMALDAGRRPQRCLQADILQTIFARELAQSTNLDAFVRRHHGHCTATQSGEQHCAIEREVFTRSSIAVPFGEPTNVFESRTIFTIKIGFTPGKPDSLKVDLAREDYYGSERRG